MIDQFTGQDKCLEPMAQASNDQAVGALELAHQRSDIKQEQSQIQQLRQELMQGHQQLEAQWASLQSQRDRLASEKSQYQDQLAKQTHQWQLIDEKHQQLIDQLEQAGQLSKQVCQQQVQLSDSVAELEKAQTQLNDKQICLEQLRSQVENDCEQLRIKQQQCQANHDELDQLLANCDERELALDDRDAQLHWQAVENDQKQQELDQFSEKLNAYKDKLGQDKQAIKQAARQAKIQALEKLAQVSQRQLEVQKQEQAVAQHQQNVEKQTARNALRQHKLKNWRHVLANHVHQFKQQRQKLVSQQQQYAGLLKQRQEIIESKKFLILSESQMVQYWAVNRSISLAAMVTLSVAVLGIGSYLASTRLARPVWRATTALQYNLGSKAKTARAHSQWRNELEKNLYSQVALDETLNQLHQRGIKAYANAEALRIHLKSALQIRSPKIGQIKLAYDANDASVVLPMVESIGRALVGYQLAKDHAQGIKTKVSFSEHAVKQQTPVQDNTWVLLAQIFAAGLGLLGLFWVGLYFVLKRSRPLFKDASFQSLFDDLENPDNWPQIKLTD